MNIFFATIIFVVVIVLLLIWFSSIDNGSNKDGIGHTLYISMDPLNKSTLFEDLKLNSTTESIGHGQILIGSSKTELKYNIVIENLSSPIVNASLYDENRKVLKKLDFMEDDEGNAALSGTWKEEEEFGLKNDAFQEIIQQILSERTYVLVETKNNSKGEIVGKILKTKS